jgi:hypothetical protein
MGLRFRIGPLNITKNGISSVSLGGRGLRVNINKYGTRTTFSLPGTGLSYTKLTPRREHSAHGMPGTGLRYQTRRTPHGERTPHDKPSARGIARLLIGIAIIAGLVALPAIGRRDSREAGPGHNNRVSAGTARTHPAVCPPAHRCKSGPSPARLTP